MDFSRYWPYAIEQEASLEHLIERFNAWSASIKDVISYFHAHQQLDQSVVFEHSKLLKNLESRQNTLGVSNIEAFKPWKDFALQAKIATETADDRITSLIIKRLVELKREIKDKISKYTSTLDNLKKLIIQSRTKTAKAIETQEKEQEARYAAKAAPSSHHLNHDPWISERLLRKQLFKMIDTENKYQRDLSVLFNEMAVFDYHIAEGMKRTMEEFALIRKSQWLAMGTVIAEASDHGSSIDSSSHFDAFAELNNLHVADLWTKERKIDDFPFQSKLIRIVESGVLQRPRPFGLGYYPVECVVTETGFFHCFKLDKAKHKVLLEKSKKKELMKIQELNNVESNATVDEKDCFNEIDGKPEFSISLGVPRMQILHIAEKSGQFCFEIVVNERKSSSLFTKNKNEDKVSKFEFKCSSESEMVEWMAILQKNIQNLIPQGPPEPLFKTQKQIEENVEALMNNRNIQLLEKYPEESDLLRNSLQADETSYLTLAQPSSPQNEMINVANTPFALKSLSLNRKPSRKSVNHDLEFSV